MLITNKNNIVILLNNQDVDKIIDQLWNKVEPQAKKQISDQNKNHIIDRIWYNIKNQIMDQIF